LPIPMMAQMQVIPLGMIGFKRASLTTPGKPVRMGPICPHRDLVKPFPLVSDY